MVWTSQTLAEENRLEQWTMDMSSAECGCSLHQYICWCWNIQQHKLSMMSTNFDDIAYQNEWRLPHVINWQPSDLKLYYHLTCFIFEQIYDWDFIEMHLWCDLLTYPVQILQSLGETINHTMVLSIYGHFRILIESSWEKNI